ncbi:MAG: carbohydrate porin, partial [Planktothrix sp.]
ISITPGFYVVTDPDHNSDNSTIVVGTLRTQFRF